DLFVVRRRKPGERVVAAAAIGRNSKGRAWRESRHGSDVRRLGTTLHPLSPVNPVRRGSPCVVTPAPMVTRAACTFRALFVQRGNSNHRWSAAALHFFAGCGLVVGWIPSVRSGERGRPIDGRGLTGRRPLGPFRQDDGPFRQKVKTLLRGYGGV